MLTEMQEKATDRLRKELDAFTGDRYELAMKKSVADALIDMAGQDEEFAQAVVQGGGFKDCMGEVKKRVKNGTVSDIDAYRAAAAFYFPGCKVQMQLVIDLVGDAALPPEKNAEKKSVIISLEDFL